MNRYAFQIRIGDDKISARNQNIYSCKSRIADYASGGLGCHRVFDKPQHKFESVGKMSSPSRPVMISHIMRNKFFEHFQNISVNQKCYILDWLKSIMESNAVFEKHADEADIYKRLDYIRYDTKLKYQTLSWPELISYLQTKLKIHFDNDTLLFSDSRTDFRKLLQNVDSYFIDIDSASNRPINTVDEGPVEIISGSRRMQKRMIENALVFLNRQEMKTDISISSFDPVLMSVDESVKAIDERVAMEVDETIGIVGPLSSQDQSTPNEETGIVAPTINYVQIALDQRLRPLTDDENREVEFALAPPYNHSVLIDMFNVEITKHKISCLRPSTWLNDEVINFYMQLLQERNRVDADLLHRRPSHYFSSFFMHKLCDTEEGYCYNNVKRYISEPFLSPIASPHIPAIPITHCKVSVALESYQFVKIKMYCVEAQKLFCDRMQI